jgi:hypothetical protein
MKLSRDKSSPPGEVNPESHRGGPGYFTTISDKKTQLREWTQTHIMVHNCQSFYFNYTASRKLAWIFGVGCVINCVRRLCRDQYRYDVTSRFRDGGQQMVDKIVRAISIRQPYVEMILRGAKTIEYRSRRTNIRERIYLYASLTVETEECDAEGYDPSELPTGVIVGTVEIVDCTEEGKSDYEWHLANPKRLPTHLKAKNQPQPGIWRPIF